MAYFVPDIHALGGVPAADDPQFHAMRDFDAAYDVRPHREVAQGIAAKHGYNDVHSIVDDIAHALEDAFAVGQSARRFRKNEAVRWTQANGQEPKLNSFAEIGVWSLTRLFLILRRAASLGFAQASVN